MAATIVCVTQDLLGMGPSVQVSNMINAIFSSSFFSSIVDYYSNYYGVF